MPRETPPTVSLPMTDNEAKMIRYLLEQASLSDMPPRWSGAARRLVRYLDILES